MRSDQQDMEVIPWELSQSFASGYPYSVGIRSLWLNLSRWFDRVVQ